MVANFKTRLNFSLFFDFLNIRSGSTVINRKLQNEADRNVSAHGKLWRAELEPLVHNSHMG